MVTFIFFHIIVQTLGQFVIAFFSLNDKSHKYSEECFILHTILATFLYLKSTRGPTFLQILKRCHFYILKEVKHYGFTHKKNHKTTFLLVLCIINKTIFLTYCIKEVDSSMNNTRFCLYIKVHWKIPLNNEIYHFL